MIHILDDFLFLVPLNSTICGRSFNQFISMCEMLGVPIKDEKTAGPSTSMTFLGIELDIVEMEARLHVPQEKVEKIRSAVHGSLFR